MQEITRAYEASIDSVMEGERSVVARINTAIVDEFRTIIDPMGADVSHYNQNPPVLWQHGKEARGSLPIGRGMVKIRKSENDMIGKCIFAKDEFSQQLFDMYKDGTLRGWSINMIPTESSVPTQEELRARPELEQCDLIYRKWKLKEFSAVAIPGNPEALTVLVSRGMWKPPDWLDPIVATVSEPVELESIEGPHIVEEGGYWHVMMDGQRSLSFSDPQLADEALRFMQSVKPLEFGYHLETQLGEIRRASQDMQQLAREYIDLYTRGRI